MVHAFNEGRSFFFRLALLAVGGIAPALRGGAGGIAPALRGGAMSICALCLVACAQSGQSAATTAGASEFPRAGEPNAEEQACSRDVECVLVDDCCGCARGGLRTGVRGDRRDALTERSAGECEQRTCADQPSQHRSCTASAARCVGGRCLPAL